MESQEKLYRRVREAKLPHDDNINLQDKIAMFRDYHDGAIRAGNQGFGYCDLTIPLLWRGDA